MNRKMVYPAFVVGMGLLGVRHGWRAVVFDTGVALILLCIKEWWAES